MKKMSVYCKVTLNNQHVVNVKESYKTQQAQKGGKISPVKSKQSKPTSGEQKLIGVRQTSI